MLDEHSRPASDSAARVDKMLKTRLEEGVDSIGALLDLIGDTPIPGADLKELLKAKHRLRVWCQRVRQL